LLIGLVEVFIGLCCYCC